MNMSGLQAGMPSDQGSPKTSRQPAELLVVCHCLSHLSHLRTLPFASDPLLVHLELIHAVIIVHCWELSSILYCEPQSLALAT